GGDDRVPELPLDLVVRVDTRLREAARDAHAVARTWSRGRGAVHLSGNLDRAIVFRGSRLALKHRWRPPGIGFTRRPVEGRHGHVNVSRRKPRPTRMLPANPPGSSSVITDGKGRVKPELHKISRTNTCTPQDIVVQGSTAFR